MKDMVAKLSCKYDDRTEEEKSLKMNFWIPENTPEYIERMKEVCIYILIHIFSLLRIFLVLVVNIMSQ
jgi:hypothetical protein